MVVETSTNSHRGTLFYSWNSEKAPKDGNLLTNFKRYYGYNIYFRVLLFYQINYEKKTYSSWTYVQKIRK